MSIPRQQGLGADVPRILLGGFCSQRMVRDFVAVGLLLGLANTGGREGLFRCELDLTNASQYVRDCIKSRPLKRASAWKRT